MLAAWFVYKSLPDDHRQVETSLHLRDIAAAYLPVIHHRPTLRLYVASALRAVTWIGFVTYLGAYFADELNLGTRQVGLVYMMLGIGYAVGSVLSARVSVFSPRAMFAGATLIGAAVLAAVLIISVTTVSVPLVVVGSLVSAFAGLAVASILVNESPAGTGTTMVLNGSMVNLGASIGALVGGILISVGGYSALGVGLPLFSVAAAILALWPAHARDAVQPTAA